MAWVILGLLLIPIYSYGIYPLMLIIPARIRNQNRAKSETPNLTIIIPAFNESGIIFEKIANTLAIKYSPDKLQIILISDGSDDGIDKMAFPPQITHLFQSERKGKAAALNRAIEYANGEWVLITDANAMVNPDALQHFLPYFNSQEYGGVSGEKKVISVGNQESTAPEGLYWKYESMVKRLESNAYSLTGAAGELFAFRRSCFKTLPQNTVLDDLYISLSIVGRGYKIAYESRACAEEISSPGIREEFARKVRIASGSLQVLPLLKEISSPVFWIQFVSHRVFRWFLVTPALAALLILSPFAWQMKGCFAWLAVAQWVFYVLALLGWIFNNRKIKIPGFYLPFYFCLMHAAQPIGTVRAIRGKESALWKKISR
jgi:poly-beta-1,6-N-acetyl-D-glucosamine synthase